MIHFKQLITAAAIIATACSITTATAGTIDFIANLTGSDVVPPNSSTNTATATFELINGPDGPELIYMIELDGLDLDGNQTTDPNDDVTAIHIHIGEPGENGPHRLNIFGMPRQDDDDLVLDPINNSLQGIWDDSDENLDSPPSFALSDALDDLNAGLLYLQIHTVAFTDGEIRGQILAVPAPGAFAAIMGIGLIGPRRRR